MENKSCITEYFTYIFVTFTNEDYMFFKSIATKKQCELKSSKDIVFLCFSAFFNDFMH